MQINLMIRLIQQRTKIVKWVVYLKISFFFSAVFEMLSIVTGMQIVPCIRGRVKEKLHDRRTW